MLAEKFKWWFQPQHIYHNIKSQHNQHFWRYNFLMSKLHCAEISSKQHYDIEHSSSQQALISNISSWITLFITNFPPNKIIHLAIFSTATNFSPNEISHWTTFFVTKNSHPNETSLSQISYHKKILPLACSYSDETFSRENFIV